MTYRIRYNDGPEYINVESRIDLTASEARRVIAEKHRWFDQANSPEPYAPWGLSVVEVIDDEDGPIERPIDWRTLRLRADEERMRDNRANWKRQAAMGKATSWWDLSEDEREHWRREADKPEPLDEELF